MNDIPFFLHSTRMRIVYRKAQVWSKIYLGLWVSRKACLSAVHNNNMPENRSTIGGHSLSSAA